MHRFSLSKLMFLFRRTHTDRIIILRCFRQDISAHFPSNKNEQLKIRLEMRTNEIKLEPMISCHHLNDNSNKNQRERKISLKLFCCLHHITLIDCRHRTDYYFLIVLIWNCRIKIPIQVELDQNTNQ